MLRLRFLRMRVMTSTGPYGADIQFEAGLNVIWADNTKGKSTCMQGMLFALGMEKMLSPHRAVPLPHAMTTFLENDDKSSVTVLESSVLLEVENGAGQVITIQRPVKQELVDNRFITVHFGAILSNPEILAQTKNYFSFDSGSAQREDGFHHFLEDFIGWKLPLVRRYDSPESKLYLETVFPLFWVEQKTGWSAIPAAIPTYLKIREVHKRAVEFIMNLDVHKLELERQRLQEQIDQNKRDWQNYLTELDRYVQRCGGKIEAVPKQPTAEPEDIERGYIEIIDKSTWVKLAELLTQLRTQVADFIAASVPTVGESAERLNRELEILNERIEFSNRFRIESYQTKQLKEVDIESLRRRISTLADDKQKNQDVQKLQRYSGNLAALTPDRCPTCEQTLVDALLSQELLTAVMPIEDNIEYIRSQLKMFQDILKREEEEQRKLEAQATLADRELNELYSRVRAIRADLIAPAGSPSAADIENRVRTEARIRELETMRSTFDNTMEILRTLSIDFTELMLKRELLPTDKMSKLDHLKLDALTTLLRTQAREFGFSTFEPDELTIDEDSYKPQKEGYEIGFETSASDAIRLKWAYQIGLLELASQYQTNHPGMLLLDEPRQQSSSKAGFSKLLEYVASRKYDSQQIIISTSEDLENLKRVLNVIKCNKKVFDGYVIKPIPLT